MRRSIWKLIARVRIWREYWRAKCLRVWGARVGKRVRIGPSCRFDRPWGATFGERVQLEPGVWLKLVEDTAQVELGNRVFVGRGGEFDICNYLSIGDDTLIAPGCFITDHAHRFSAGSSIADQGVGVAPVMIGRDVWIGAHSIVLPGVTIGDGAIVGANSLVNCDVEPFAIVAGSPARSVGTRA